MDIIFFSPFNEIKTRGGEFGSKESQEFWVGCDFFSAVDNRQGEAEELFWAEGT